jgi:nucleotide-binding universal stress UspA family protein
VCYAYAPIIRQILRDAMKSILLPVEQNEQMPSAFETAWLAASLLDGVVEGAALPPAFTGTGAKDAKASVATPPHDRNQTEYSRRVRQTFDDYAMQHATESVGAGRFRWRDGPVIQDAALGSLARVYDLTVLNRPGARGGRMATLEAVLFESGRPILMAPPSLPKSFAQTVVIHWNASTEVSRAISMAMPILRKAKRVIVLSVEGTMVPGPTVQDAVSHLRAHDVAATEKTIATRGQRPGAALLAEARAQGADLLIKGAYTQSRLRQMIFGGATQHVLAAAELPVFLVD